MNEKAIRVYQKVFGEEPGNDHERASIIKDISGVAAAPTEEAAMEVIRWWGCWEGRAGMSNGEKELRRCVRRVRRLMRG